MKTLTLIASISLSSISKLGVCQKRLGKSCRSSNTSAPPPEGFEVEFELDEAAIESVVVSEGLFSDAD